MQSYHCVLPLSLVLCADGGKNIKLVDSACPINWNGTVLFILKFHSLLDYSHFFWFVMAGSVSTQRFKIRNNKVARIFISRRKIDENLPSQRIKLSQFRKTTWRPFMVALVPVVYF